MVRWLSVITDVGSRSQGSAQVTDDQMLRRVARSANQHANPLFEKQGLRALSDSSGDDHVNAALCQPSGKQSRLVRRSINVFAHLYLLLFFVGIDNGELGTMAKV